VAEWIRNSAAAQDIWDLCYFFKIPLPQVSRLTPMQTTFLLAGLHARGIRK